MDPATEKFNERYGIRRPAESDVGLDVEFLYHEPGDDYPTIQRGRVYAVGEGVRALTLAQPDPFAPRKFYDTDRITRYHESQPGPDGEHFPWGDILQTIEVGPYTLVEHRRNQAGNVADEDFTPHTMWSAWFEGKGQSYIYDSLDRALIGMVARANDGDSTRADRYMARMIGLA